MSVRESSNQFKEDVHSETSETQRYQLPQNKEVSKQRQQQERRQLSDLVIQNNQRLLSSKFATLLVQKERPKMKKWNPNDKLQLSFIQLSLACDKICTETQITEVDLPFPCGPDNALKIELCDGFNEGGISSRSN